MVYILVETFEKYLADKTALGERTQKEYSYIVRKYMSENKGNLTLGNVNRFIKKRNFLSYRNALKHYLKFRGIEYDLIKVKSHETKPKEVPKFNEFMKVIKSLHGEDKLLALFLMETGCRIHEAFKIKVKDIRKDGSIVIKTKGGKSRMIVFSPGYARELQTYLDVEGFLDNEYLFYQESQATNRAKTMIYWKKLNSKSKELIGKYIGTHDFRRFYIGYLVFELKKPIEIVKDIVGHSDIRTTYIYIKRFITEQRIKEAAVDLESLHKKVTENLDQEPKKQGIENQGNEPNIP